MIMIWQKITNTYSEQQIYYYSFLNLVLYVMSFLQKSSNNNKLFSVYDWSACFDALNILFQAAKLMDLLA